MRPNMVICKLKLNKLYATIERNAKFRFNFYLGHMLTVRYLIEMAGADLDSVDFIDGNSPLLLGFWFLSYFSSN